MYGLPKTLGRYIDFPTQDCHTKGEWRCLQSCIGLHKNILCWLDAGLIGLADVLPPLQND